MNFSVTCGRQHDHIFGARKGPPPMSPPNCWRKLRKASLKSEGTVAAKRTTISPPIIERWSKIDQRCYGFPIRKQGPSMKVRKTLVGDAEAVSPNQPTVFLDAPSLGYLSANHLLAVCRAAQHQPLERQ